MTVKFRLYVNGMKTEIATAKWNLWGERQVILVWTTKKNLDIINELNKQPLMERIENYTSGKPRSSNVLKNPINEMDKGVCEDPPNAGTRP